MKKRMHTLAVALVAALVTATAMAALAIADDSNSPVAESAASKKFNKKQLKQVRSLIKKELRKKVGPTGATGANGANGAASGYFGTGVAVSSFGNDVSSYTTVLTKALPAGKFVVNADVAVTYAASDDEFAINAQCRAKTPDNTILDTGQDSTEADIFVLLFVSGIANVPLNFTVDAAAPTTITVECSTGYDSDGSGAAETASVTAENSRLSAIQVNSIG